MIKSILTMGVCLLISGCGSASKKDTLIGTWKCIYAQDKDSIQITLNLQESGRYTRSFSYFDDGKEVRELSGESTGSWQVENGFLKRTADRPNTLTNEKDSEAKIVSVTDKEFKLLVGKSEFTYTKVK